MDCNTGRPSNAACMISLGKGEAGSVTTEVDHDPLVDLLRLGSSAAAITWRLGETFFEGI